MVSHPEAPKINKIRPVSRELEERVDHFELDTSCWSQEESLLDRETVIQISPKRRRGSLPDYVDLGVIYCFLVEQHESEV